MARPASLSGWLLEAGRRLPVQMNDYPRQNPAYRLTRLYQGTHSNASPLSLDFLQPYTPPPSINLMYHFKCIF